MPVQECGLDAAGRSICLSWSGKYWNDLTVLVDGGIVARVPDLEELKSGKKIILKDGTVLKIQIVGNTLQVMSNGRSLSGEHNVSDPTQGNWLTSQIKNSKVAAIFSETILCRIRIHQGTWTTEDCSGCWQRRFCMYCGIPQQRERHIWPPKADGEYFKDGSCKTRVTCFRCEKTKLTGKKHEGQISFWNAHCKRCGENLGNYGGG